MIIKCKNDMNLIEKETDDEFQEIVCRYKRKGLLLFQVIVNNITFPVDEVEVLEGNVIRLFKNNIMVCSPITEHDLFVNEVVLTI